MAQWQDIGPAQMLGPGKHRVVALPDYTVLLVNLNGTYYAVENICTHDGGELDGGEIENDTITCPRHGACFCLKTGRVLKPPAFEDLECFPVRLRAGRVEIFDEPAASAGEDV